MKTPKSPTIQSPPNLFGTGSEQRNMLLIDRESQFVLQGWRSTQEILQQWKLELLQVLAHEEKMSN